MEKAAESKQSFLAVPMMLPKIRRRRSNESER